MHIRSLYTHTDWYEHSAKRVFQRYRAVTNTNTHTWRQKVLTGTTQGDSLSSELQLWTGQIFLLGTWQLLSTGDTASGLVQCLPRDVKHTHTRRHQEKELTGQKCFLTLKCLCLSRYMGDIWRTDNRRGMKRFFISTISSLIFLWILLHVVLKDSVYWLTLLILRTVWHRTNPLDIYLTVSVISHSLHVVLYSICHIRRRGHLACKETTEHFELKDLQHMTNAHLTWCFCTSWSE